MLMLETVLNPSAHDMGMNLPRYSGLSRSINRLPKYRLIMVFENLLHSDGLALQTT